MTMQQMNEYLEKRGFEVTRKYVKNLEAYDFTIEKNGKVLSAYFKYPVTKDLDAKNKLMTEFLEKIVRDFEQQYHITDMDVHSMYPDPEKFYVCMARHNGKTQLQREFLEDLMKRGGINGRYGITCNYHPEIKDVIFNDPATIVFWADGTKTVVKCQEGDEFDPEKGLTMAIAKKVYGNKGSYCNVIKKWVEPYYEKLYDIDTKKAEEALDALAETAQRILGSIPSLKFKIKNKKSDVDCLE